MSYFSISAVKGLQFFKLCSGKFFPLDPSRGCGISWDRCLVYAYFVASSGCKESHFYSLPFGQAEANIY